MSMIKAIQRKTASSEKGAKGLAEHGLGVAHRPHRNVHRLRRERPSSRQGVLAPAKAGFVRSRANQGGTTAKFAVLDLCQGRFFCCIARMIPSSGRAGWGGPPSPEMRRTKPREKGEHREFTHHPNSTSE